MIFWRCEMKKLINLLLVFMLLLLWSCGTGVKEDITTNQSETEEQSETTEQLENQYNISKKYWGTWIRMDTGDEYYIDSDKVYKCSSSNKKYSEVQSGISGFTLEGENVLKNGSLAYFRKGGTARDFSLKVSGFSDSTTRAAASTMGGIKACRKGNNNDSDTEVVTSSEEGIIKFTGAVADDVQVVTVEDTSVSLIPQYNGENSGTIPIVEKGMYGFKITYTINSDEQGYCYGSLYKVYDLKLNINNIGDVICETSVYEITCDDARFDFVSGSLTGNFSSIEAGKSKSLDFKVRYGQVDEEYIDVPIKISITDSKYERTWVDTITLRFHRGVVALKVNSRNFDSNSKAQLKGFVIYPDGRSKRFTVSPSSVASVLIPWSKSNYILAFSGATVDNEMAYSFGFDKTVSLADLSGTWSISEINAYEKNDSVTTAVGITDLSKPVKAYLKSGDLDFYKINNSEIDIGFKPVTYVASGISDAVTDKTMNNGDGIVNSGEIIKMDIRVKNVTENLISGITAKLSTTCSYITIAEAEKNYGNITGGYYKTLYGASRYAEDSSYKNGYTYSSNAGNNYSATLGASYGWQFTVSEDAPADTEIPFTITFTDSRKNTWIENFTYTVRKVGVELECVAKEISDATSLGAKNNGDGKVNSDEVIKLDIRVHNNGATLAQGITGVLSTTSDYVTIAEAEKNYGNITGGYYKTLYGASRYAEDSSYKNGYTYSSNAGNNYSATLGASYGWQFTVASDTPDNTEIPFTITFTDSRGNIWTDSISITVQ